MNRLLSDERIEALLRESQVAQQLSPLDDRVDGGQGVPDALQMMGWLRDGRGREIREEKREGCAVTRSYANRTPNRPPCY